VLVIVLVCCFSRTSYMKRQTGSARGLESGCSTGLGFLRVRLGLGGVGVIAMGLMPSVYSRSRGWDTM
jgi:hypothetical protein